MQEKSSHLSRQLQLAIKQGRLPDAMKLVFDSNVSVNTQTDQGVSILHLAALRGTADDLNRLLDQGADVALATYDLHETAYDLAVRLKSTNNAQFLRIPTLKAMMSSIGKTILATGVTVEAAARAASLFGGEQSVRNMAGALDSENIAYSALTGENFQSSIASHGAVTLLNHGPEAMLKELGKQVILRKTSSIGNEQSGLAGAVISSVLAQVIMEGLHVMRGGHWATVIPDLPTQLSVGVTLAYTNLLGTYIGRELGNDFARMRIGDAPPNADDVSFIKSYQALGAALGTAYMRNLLAETMQSLINRDIATPARADAPEMFMPIATGVVVGGALGAYLEHKTGTSLLPITGGVAGAMMCGAIAMMLASQILNTEEKDIDTRLLLDAPPVAATSNILFYMGNAAIHTAAVAATAKFANNHGKQIRNIANILANDVGWLYNSTSRACNTATSYLKAANIWKEKVATNSQNQQSDAHGIANRSRYKEEKRCAIM